MKIEPKVMVNVATCSHSGCNYTTNIRGDMTRHRREKHPKVKIR